MQIIINAIKSFDNNNGPESAYKRFVQQIDCLPLGQFNLSIFQGGLLESGREKTFYILGEEILEKPDIVVRRALFVVFNETQLKTAKQLLYVYFPSTLETFIKAQVVYHSIYKPNMGLTPPPLKVYENGRETGWLFDSYPTDLNSILNGSLQVKVRAILSLCKAVEHLHLNNCAHGSISLETVYIRNEKVFLAMENGFILNADSVDFDNDVVRIYRVIETLLTERVVKPLSEDRSLDSIIHMISGITLGSSTSPDIALSSSEGESTISQKALP